MSKPSDPKSPKPGDLHIDASAVPVIDLLPEQIPKLSKLRDGYDEAVDAIASLTPQAAARAGIHTDEIARAVELAAEIKTLDVFVPAADKLAELMRETRLERGHQLAGILTEAAAQARRRAERDPNGAAILAPLEDLLDFQYGPAAKANVTKEKEKAKETTVAPKAADTKAAEPSSVSAA
jgi:hypothetical protein